jgi:DNA-binding transcriptional ArsR family regulator
MMTPSSDRLSQTFGALADPVRRAILGRLMRGPALVGELAEPFDISLPAISRHLKVLAEAGLIEREQRGQQRVCSLKVTGLQSAANWIEHMRRFWSDRLDALDDHLNEEKGAYHGRTKSKGRRKRG